MGFEVWTSDCCQYQIPQGSTFGDLASCWRCHVKQSESETGQISTLQLPDFVGLTTRLMRGQKLNVTEPIKPLCCLKLVLSDSARLEVETPYLPPYVGARLQQIFLKKLGATSVTDAGAKETFSFQAEVGQLLDIVARSLYSNREIFLRELVSNASDACDKLRYETLTNPSLAADAVQFVIAIEANKKAKTLSVSGNGIGMSHDDLIETLGTIAKSGTGAFLESLKDGEKGELGLIGQFGVGFYSAFMVADSVEVLTRKAGEEKSWSWSSDGKGQFTIEPGDRGECGTTVVLHLKKDAKEFLEEARLRHIIKTYSDHISFPVTLGAETLNSASAIWTRAPKDVTEEQHTEFYHHTSHAFDKPWLVLHNRVEGAVSHISLLYIPSTAPFDLYDAERKSHVKLYVNRVFISENTKGLIPTRPIIDRWLPSFALRLI